MRNKRHIIICVILILLPSAVFSQSRWEIKEGSHILDKERVYSDGEILALPDFSFSEQIRRNIQRHGTMFLTEITWVMPELPSRFADTTVLSHLFADVNSLEGIEYWSGGRDRMHPYVKKSYRVASNGDRTALPPIQWPTGADSVRFVQYQKDTSFGSNWYDVTLYRNDDAVLMETVNLTDLKAFTKRTQDAGGILLQMAVIPESNRTVMYCAVAFQEFPPIGWGQSAVSGSFNHRISAIQSWFANTVFGKEEN